MSEMIECPTCEGEGEIECGECGGTGKEDCPHCDASGEVNKNTVKRAQ